MLDAMADALDAVAGRLRAIAGPTEATLPSAADTGDSKQHGGPPEHWLMLVRRGAPQLLREGSAQAKHPSGPVFQTQPKARPAAPRTPSSASMSTTPAPRFSAQPTAEAIAEPVIAAHPLRPATNAQAEAAGPVAPVDPAEPAATKPHVSHSDALPSEIGVWRAFDLASRAQPSAFPVPLAGPSSGPPAPGVRIEPGGRKATGTVADPAVAVDPVVDAFRVPPQAPAQSDWPRPSAAEPSPRPADEVSRPCPWPNLPDEDEPREDANRRWPRLPYEGGHQRGRGWNG